MNKDKEGTSMAFVEIKKPEELKQHGEYFLRFGSDPSLSKVRFLEVTPEVIPPEKEATIWTTGELPSAQFTSWDNISFNFIGHNRSQLLDRCKEGHVRIYEKVEKKDHENH